MSKKIAVIGGGYWGKNLIRNFHELGSLFAVCDIDENALKGYNDQLSNVFLTTQYSDIIENKDIDAVVIALPAHLHFDYAHQALLAGKDVYCEKPLTIDINESKKLVEISQEKNKILMVGHLLQYHPVFIKLKEMVHSGSLGKLQYIYSNRLSMGKIRGEENVLWSFAPHDLSMILSLVNEDPINVVSSGGCYVQKNIEDIVMTQIKFASGIAAHIFSSWLNPVKDHRFVVVGSDRMAVFCDSETEWENKLQVYPYVIVNNNNQYTPVKKNAERVEVTKSEPLKNECMHFIECIEQRKMPVTDGEEGLRVLRALQQAQSSLSQNILL